MQRRNGCLTLVGITAVIIVGLVCGGAFMFVRATLASDTARGHRNLATGNYRAAISAYSTAIALNPNDSDAYCSRGSAHFNLKEYQQAADDCTAALAINPGQIPAYLHRGASRRGLGDYAGAVSDLTIYIGYQPNSVSAWYERGLAYDRSGDATHALADYQRMVALYDAQHGGIRADLYTFAQQRIGELR